MDSLTRYQMSLDPEDVHESELMDGQSLRPALKSLPFPPLPSPSPSSPLPSLSVGRTCWPQIQARLLLRLLNLTKNLQQNSLVIRSAHPGGHVVMCSCHVISHYSHVTASFVQALPLSQTGLCTDCVFYTPPLPRPLPHPLPRPQTRHLPAPVPTRPPLRGRPAAGHGPAAASRQREGGGKGGQQAAVHHHANKGQALST